MCTELYDPDAKVWATSPRELASFIGKENIVWHDAYDGIPDGSPSVDDDLWMDSCLCPVDIGKTMAKIGGESHGYRDSGYFEITLPSPSPYP